jgi:hypothetical protein
MGFIVTLNPTAFSLMTLSITGLIKIISINDTQHMAIGLMTISINDTQYNCLIVFLSINDTQHDNCLTRVLSVECLILC